MKITPNSVKVLLHLHKKINPQDIINKLERELSSQDFYFVDGSYNVETYNFLSIVTSGKKYEEFFKGEIEERWDGIKDRKIPKIPLSYEGIIERVVLESASYISPSKLAEDIIKQVNQSA